MSTLIGTRALVRLALRRDRVRIPVWLFGITVLVVSTASSFERLFPTVEERTQFAVSVAANASFRALYGPAFDLSTTGGLTAWRILAAAAVYAALMSLLLTVRHTRAEEEAGRSELLGATVVGRYAGLASALIVVGIANLGTAFLVSLGLTGLGLPAGGSVAFGLALALTGWLFGAMAAVSAQIASTGRAAGGAVGAVLGLAFVLRAAGDVGDGTLSWFSPIGWAQRIRPFAGERWWVMALPLLATAILLPIAVALASRRDQGAGLLSERRGPESASPRLGGPWGLAWRLQRGALMWWTVGFVTAGATVGSVAYDVNDLGERIGEMIRRITGGTIDLVDAFIASIMGMFALVAAGYMIQALLRLRAEETATRAEPVLATPVSRWGWAGPHLVFAALGSVVVLAAGGIAVGLAHGLRAGDVGGQVVRVLAAGLAQVPAVWVLGGLAFAVAGALPRLVALAWAAFGVFFGLQWIGELLELPDLVLDVSPFRHSPRFPLADVTAGPLLALALIAIALSALGHLGLSRRDIS